MSEVSSQEHKREAEMTVQYTAFYIRSDQCMVPKYFNWTKLRLQLVQLTKDLCDGTSGTDQYSEQ